jgi:hypothetical protein
MSAQKLVDNLHPLKNKVKPLRPFEQAEHVGRNENKVVLNGCQVPSGNASQVAVQSLHVGYRFISLEVKCRARAE